jgi:hypothetical protein
MPRLLLPCVAQFLREFFHVLHGCSHLVRRFYHVQRGQRYLLEPSRVESLGFSFPGTSSDPLFCSSCRTNSHKPDSFVNVLEECNPVILVLVLMLVSVGRPSAGARGSKQSVLLAFLLSIHHLRNYEEKHGEMMMYQDLSLKDLVSTSTVVCEYVCTKNIRKRKSIFVSETLRNGIPFPFPRHSKMEFRFRFPNTLKWNSVSISGLHYSINPNTHHCCKDKRGSTTVMVGSVCFYLHVTNQLDSI